MAQAWPVESSVEQARRCEAELLARVRAAAPLRRALARLAGRWVETRGWERLGFARLKDYAAERAGVGARELYDLARVDRRLAGLPRCDEAFVRGRIGWTSLRLVCRVATPEDEEDWLAKASSPTAGALAREVRAVDQKASVPDLEEDEDAPRRSVVMCVSPCTQASWWRTRQLANRVAGQALSHAEFAEALLGEVLSAAPLEVVFPEEEEGSEGGRPAGRGGDERGGVGAGSVWAEGDDVTPPAFVTALVDGIESADAFELDARLCRALRLEAGHLARVADGLCRVAAWGAHRDLGFNSLDRYAEGRLGMSASRARALLRIERAGQVCPALREAFASGAVTWVQAHTLVPLLLEDHSYSHRKDWIEHAGRVSVRRLEGDVGEALASGDLTPPPLRPMDPAGLQTGANTALRNGAQLPAAERRRMFFVASREVANLFRATLAAVQKRIERVAKRPSSEDEALAAMLDHALATWEAPLHARTARERRSQRIFERDGWRCTAPGCSSYRNLHVHHIVFRSHGGSDDAWNETTLCAWHHLRGIHAGRVRCTGRAPDGLRFELGRRAGAPPLLRYAPGEVRMPG